MMHPSGTTTVVFTVSRNGLPGAARIATGSGADMLDAQAVSIVALCRFPPMPAQAFGGAEAHEFSVQITFPPFVSGD
jgi:TonB family protein